MAIESISSMPAYQAVSTVQATQPVKQSADNTREGEGLQNISTQAVNNIDPETASVASVSLEDDGNGSAYANSQEQQNRDNEKIKRYVDDLSKKMNNSEIQFGIHDATNRVTIKIIDKETKDVIKELPPEKTLDMIAKVWEIAGMMVDERR